MKTLLFDMDGVLLEPNGYHMALKETVRLVSRSMGFEDFLLSDQNIAQFEALGISSEWHSSALCAALLMIKTAQYGREINVSTSLNTTPTKNQKYSIDIARLFKAIESQPAELPAILRAQMAIEWIAKQNNIDPEQPSLIIKNSESIEHSLTFNVFQELVLGSEIFDRTYQRKKQLNVISFLQKFDKSLLSDTAKDKLLRWLEYPQHNAAIMTNRPTAITIGKTGSPEAELCAELIGLESLPIIGNGEIRWLAHKTNTEVGALLKPAPTHALAATFAAFGNSLEDSLINAYNLIHANHSTKAQVLSNNTVYVFEDTVAGIMSVEGMQKVLEQNNTRVQIHKFGISSDPIKRSCLKDHGAKIYDSINAALSELI